AAAVAGAAGAHVAVTQADAHGPAQPRALRHGRALVGHLVAGLDGAVAVLEGRVVGLGQALPGHALRVGRTGGAYRAVLVAAALREVRAQEVRSRRRGQVANLAAVIHGHAG